MFSLYWKSASPTLSFAVFKYFHAQLDESVGKWPQKQLAINNE